MAGQWHSYLILLGVKVHFDPGEKLDGWFGEILDPSEN